MRTGSHGFTHRSAAGKQRFSLASRAAIGVSIVLLALTVRASAAAENDPFFERLAGHVQNLASLDASAKQIISEAISLRNEETDDQSLVVEVLALMSSEFRDALDSFDGEDYATCLRALSGNCDSADPYLRVAARSYEVRALVHTKRLLEAQEKIEALVGDVNELRAYSLDEAEMVYMLGYCRLQNLQYEKARQTLDRFLEEYPDAPPRFIVTARQMLAELSRRIPESIGEVADLMSFSQKRLAAGSTAGPVQAAQARVIDLLDKLIEQVEEQEQSQMAGGGGQLRPMPQNRRASGDPQAPAQDSNVPPSDSREPAKEPGRRVSPAEAWGNMPDAQREVILQVLRERFPGRYRTLVEQYYQSLAEQQ